MQNNTLRDSFLDSIKEGQILKEKEFDEWYNMNAGSYFMVKIPVKSKHIMQFESLLKNKTHLLDKIINIIVFGKRKYKYVCIFNDTGHKPVMYRFFITK